MQYNRIIANIKVWHLFVFALLIAALTAILNPLPANDVIARYAPAAEAFAKGDWLYAFHPRFGVYFTAFAGFFVWLTGVNGVVACKIVSILFFSVSVFPLYKLFNLIWNNKIALQAVLLYCLCSHLLRYAGDGVRDNGKTLALSLIGCGLVSFYKKDHSVKSVLLFSSGCALLTVLRGEGTLIALCCGITGVFLLKQWRLIFVGTAMFFLMIFPQLLYNFIVIGYPVPELRHGVILDKAGIPPAAPLVKIPETAR